MTKCCSHLGLPRLIAILRGLQPEDAVAVGRILLAAGMTAWEIPLNRPGALASIAVLNEHFGSEVQLGAGTLLDEAGLEAARDAGARFMFSPHHDASLVAKCLDMGLLPIPGVATPSEGFAAVRAGAQVLKLFPCDLLTPKVVRAWRAVFPEQISFIAVGGVDADNILPYLHAGVHGVAVGSWLYKPGVAHPELACRARTLVARIEEFESC